MSWTFDAELFLWQGEGAWHFVRLPVELSDDVRDGLEGPPGGFGSVRVTVTCGGSTWQTSLFPEKAGGCYLLPVRKAVRAAEGIEEGDLVTFGIELA